MEHIYTNQNVCKLLKHSVQNAFLAVLLFVSISFYIYCLLHKEMHLSRDKHQYPSYLFMIMVFFRLKS